MDYTFFFAAINHDLSAQVVKTLEAYIEPSASYIIALEVSKGCHLKTNGEHFHFAVQMSDERYKLFYKTFCNRFKLAGKNNKKGWSYWGKIDKKNIRNETKFLSYTVKDNNLITRNMDETLLQQYLDDSFQKKDYLDELMTHLEELCATCNTIFESCPSTAQTYPINVVQLEKQIMIHHIRNNPNKVLMPNKLFYYALTFLQHYSHLTTYDQIYGYMKNRY